MSDTNQVYYKIKVGKQRGSDDSSHMMYGYIDHKKCPWNKYQFSVKLWQKLSVNRKSKSVYFILLFSKTPNC